MPGAKQAWPKVAACWSPATPAIGIGAAPSSPAALSPSTPLEGTMAGSSARGMWNSRSSSSSQSCVWMSISRVRAALLGSVACTRPAVSL